MVLEALEDRIALSTIVADSHAALIRTIDTASHSGGPNTIVQRDESPVLDKVATSTVTVGASGNVTVTAPDGSTRIYQKAAHGWNLIAWSQETPRRSQRPVWVEASFAPDGALIENVWKQKQHGALGSADQLGQLTVQGDRITLVAHHGVGYRIYWGLQAADTKDATVTWIYSRGSMGQLGNELEYHVSESNSSWSANWTAKGGWSEHYPWYEELVPDRIGASFVLDEEDFNKAGIEQRSGPALVADPPGLPVERETHDGLRTETVWNGAHTQSTSFVYGGPDQDTLIEQTYGQMAGGKWVTKTDHSQAFITQTATYDKPSGNLQTSVTERKDPDGRTTTFNGTWSSGTRINNATGVETAVNYLGFSSVTVQYQNGKPITRYGPLQSGLGWRYATDTFNGSGTSVIKREISQTQGGPVVETWTSSGKDLIISRSKPTSDIKQDTFTYQWDAPHSYTSYTLLHYNATFTHEVTLYYTPKNDTESGERKSTTYNWRAFASYNKADDDWEWHYREIGEHVARNFPDPQVPGWREPKLDDYWNKV